MNSAFDPDRRETLSGSAGPDDVSYAFANANLALRVVGRRWGEAGRVEFLLASRLVDKVVLPKMEWAVFAVLSEAAALAPVDSLDAFLSSRQLANRLLQRGVIDSADPMKGIRTVYRLRERLETLPIANAICAMLAAPPNNFASSLIMRDKLLGYRINLHPDDLQMVFT